MFKTENHFLCLTRNYLQLHKNIVVNDNNLLLHPSKQNLELKSSKTRLLPSRSGVLIEFQSGVFTGNSRAISGLKLEFSPS